MKKTIEQKAKAYDEAIERAKNLHKDAIGMGENIRAKQCEIIFPELAESEDEKIRKELINFLQLPHPQFVGERKQEKWIAWLEKQGEKESKKVPIWKHWKDGIAGNGEGEPIYLTKVGNTYSLTSCLGFECDYIELSELDNLMLEKQGEQKPIDYNEELKKCRKNPLYFFDKYVKLEERKSADKVESKFHEGDWVANDYCVGKVIALTDDAYLLDSGQGIPFSCEHNAHLWTIQDAKDGDVLACENGWTCIFNCLHDNLFDSHCFMDAEGWFCEDGGQAHTLDNRICGEIHPATKEQRDLLFQKMHEAGYEWNAEKKELKKIENVIPTAWSEEDERIRKDLIGFFKDEAFLCHKREEIIAWLEKQSSAWSEEDEIILTNIILMLEVGVKNNFIKDNMSKVIIWLKSIKQRIGG